MSPHRKHLSGRGYFVTWIVLVVLTLSSFGVSYAPLGVFDLVISLVIAAAKATIVALFFMHLIEQRFANRLVVLVSVFMVVLLVLLMAADVATRRTFPPVAEPPAES